MNNNANMNNMNNSMNNVNSNMTNSFGNMGQNSMSYSAGNVPPTNNNNQPPELIPRGDKTLTDNTLASMAGGQKVLNINFKASTGLNVVICAPVSTKKKDLLKQYVHRIGIGESHIGKSIIFLFNGEKMDTNSDETLHNFPDFATVTVFDQNNVIGA
jgi:hypothetical protein